MAKPADTTPFVDSPGFHEPDADERYVVSLPVLVFKPGESLCEQLGPDELRTCFLMMNYLRFRSVTASDASEAKRLKAKANEVRAVLVASGQRLVHWFVAKFLKRNPSIAKAELISVGNDRLMYAIGRFDALAGVEFCSYFGVTITGGLLRYLKKEYAVRTKLESWPRRLEVIMPDDSIRVADVIDIRHIVDRTLSHGRDREVFEAACGLDGFGSKSIRDVAGLFKLSKSRVGQIVEKALSHLREHVAVNDRQRQRRSMVLYRSSVETAVMPATTSETTMTVANVETDDAGSATTENDGRGLSSEEMPGWLVEAWPGIRAAIERGENNRQQTEERP